MGSIAWSADGQCLASQCNFEIILWYPASGACTHTRSAYSGANSLGWSPDGRYLAYVGQDKTIQLWDGNFFSLLTIPLAFYTDYQWRSLTTLQQESLGLKDWQRPWLEFIAALSLLVRRFDVSLDNQSSKTASSIFDIEIDG
jgi:WD40 repeat protein